GAGCATACPARARKPARKPARTLAGAGRPARMVERVTGRIPLGVMGRTASNCRAGTGWARGGDGHGRAIAARGSAAAVHAQHLAADP
ncbi:hypothetical protein DQE84_16130, partial [Staphylococcus warneri]